jgi:hypothetical protein
MTYLNARGEVVEGTGERYTKGETNVDKVINRQGEMVRACLAETEENLQNTADSHNLTGCTVLSVTDVPEGEVSLLRYDDYQIVLRVRRAGEDVNVRLGSLDGFLVQHALKAALKGLKAQEVTW